MPCSTGWADVPATCSPTPAAGHQDLHRHRDAADAPQAGAASGSRRRARIPPIRPWCRSSTKGMFQRIARRIPWTTTGSGRPKAGRGRARRKQSRSTPCWAIFRAALAAAKKVKPPFTLATCGWVLGPPQSPRAVRRASAQRHADELHQPHGGQHAGRAGLRQRQGPAEMGHSVDGRRSAA